MVKKSLFVLVFIIGIIIIPTQKVLADEIKIILPQATPGNIYVQEIPISYNKIGKIDFSSKNMPGFLKLYENYIFGNIPQGILEQIKFDIEVKTPKTTTNLDITIPIKKTIPKIEEIIYFNNRIGYKINGQIIANSEIKNMEKNVKNFLENTAKPLGITPRHTKIPNQMTNEEKVSYISNLLNITQIQSEYENSNKGDEAKTKLVQSLRQHQQDSNLLYLTFKVRELENSKK